MVPVPTATPFLRHCKIGVVPPLTGEAVNVTGVPAHIFVDVLADKLIAGTSTVALITGTVKLYTALLNVPLPTVSLPL